MLIQLDQLDEPHFSWRETLSIPLDELADDDVAALGEIACRGTIDVTSSGYVLRILLQYSQTLSCVRCLETVETPIEAEIAVLLSIRDNDEAVGEDEPTLARDDLGLVLLENPLLDTRDLVREQVQLGIPMKPLCRDDCAGLCGTCGQNLNDGPCACEPEVDPRWAALDALRSVN